MRTNFETLGRKTKQSLSAGPPPQTCFASLGLNGTWLGGWVSQSLFPRFKPVGPLRFSTATWGHRRKGRDHLKWGKPRPGEGPSLDGAGVSFVWLPPSWDLGLPQVSEPLPPSCGWEEVIGALWVCAPRKEP